MGLFDRKAKPSIESIPPVLTTPEDPVNYNSVLDYLTGLSDGDYKKMTKSAEIYRAANEKVAAIVGIENEPTTALTTPKPSDEEIDDALDDALAGTFVATDEPEAPKPTKAQAPKTKIEIKD